MNVWLRWTSWGTFAPLWALAMACGPATSLGRGTDGGTESTTATNTSTTASGSRTATTSTANSGRSSPSGSTATNTSSITVTGGNPSQGPICGAVAGAGGSPCAVGQVCCEFYVDGGYGPRCTSPGACPVDAGQAFAMDCTGKASCAAGTYCCQRLGVSPRFAQCQTSPSCPASARYGCFSNADCDLDAGVSTCEFYGPFGPGACY
jgi:hypothetical protein